MDDDTDTDLTFTPRIGDMASEDRPRERLAQAGPEALNNAELLAILLRTGLEGENAVRLGERLLAQHGGLVGLLKMSYTDLCKVKGIGPAKAAQLKAAVELGRRIAAASPAEKPTINSPADAANVIMYEMRALDQEVVRVLLLDTRNRLMGTVEVYRGSLNTSMIRVGELFREAIKQSAASIIVAHNHPSGDPSPSPDDVAVTRMMVEAGRLLDIPVHDHIVIGHNRFVSLKERGLGFS
ncbi:MAG: JAB domain-containing protein [Chloroflexi bacterium]|nr:JAB domain-containing protein [Chloroflexota bacterium]